MTQQPLVFEDLRRVNSRIGAAIVAFCEPKRVFHMDDLRDHITRAVGKVAPASPDRILRQLRATGQVNYKILSRRDSLYEITGVHGVTCEEISDKM